MARPKRDLLQLKRLAGMNTTDPDVLLLPDQAAYIQNIDLSVGGLGKKRVGFTNAPTTGTEPQGVAGATTKTLFRHVPGGSDTDAELWAAVRLVGPGTWTLSRYAAGTWTTVATPDVPVTGDGNHFTFATFNGKLFIAYDSAVNRLHVWDGAQIRRVGLAPPAVAPGLANIGAGALNFTRFYRVRFVNPVAGSPPVVLVSEAGPSASITVAASAGVRVTRPALVDGIELQWLVEAAATANGPWFTISPAVPIATLTFDDTSATIPTTSPAPEAGLYTLPPSAKYLAVYQNQIIMAGAWETTSIGGQSVPKNNRVWYTRPLGALEISDDEAITTTLTLKFYVDTGEDNDRITGLSYPVDGIPYVAKLRQVWSLIPRDDPNAPFAAVRLTDTVGTSAFAQLVVGEDERGRPALYFSTPTQGLYRLGRAGMQFCGRDLINLLPGVYTTNPQLLWVPDLRQLWVLGSGNRVYIFNARLGAVDENADVRNGWAVYTVTNVSVNCGALFAASFNVNLVELRPVIGGLDGAGSMVWQVDNAANSDVGALYQGYTLSAAYPLGQFLYNVSIYPPRLYALPGTSGTSTLQCRVFRNMGDELIGVTPQVSTASVTEFGTPTKIATFEGVSWSDGEVFQFEIGDAAPSTQGWQLLTFVVPYQRQEEAE